MNLQRQIALSKSELISVLIIFIFIAAIVMTTRLIRLTSDSAIVFKEQTEFIISQRSGLDSLQVVLNKNEVSYDVDELNWASSILGWRNFQRGRYVFEGKYSYNGFLSKISRGIQDPVPIVILPGITPERLTNNLSEKLHFDSLEFVRVLSDSIFLAEKNLTSEQLFGRMFPETYLIYWTATPRELISKILREFDAALTREIQDRADELGITINELVTLSSIVEWEAKNQEEKPRISGLYWNRLNRGMRLQADPTINYVIGERRRLLFEDYQIDHPYNTYMRAGLPPGPITNPSLSSIEATLFPEEHDYLYMVANPEGGHIFTKTFREHQVESEKWRIWLREQYRIKRQREAEQQNAEKETR